MSNAAAVQWANWGRGDLSIIRKLGANALRVHGNDPALMKRSFLDHALRLGLDVIAGNSFWYGPKAASGCSQQQYNCYSEAYAAYKANLMNGFAINNYTAYHPALKAINIIDEPELVVAPA